MRRFLQFVLFLTSNFQKPTCFALFFDVSSGYDKVQKNLFLYIGNILETFVKIRISSDKAQGDWLQTALSSCLSERIDKAVFNQSP